jgi:hypothetical protein
MAGNVNILVVGEHNVGKTNYGIQLLGRLRVSQSQLKMPGVAESIAPFEAGLSALNEGMPPEHTPVTANHELTLPLELGGRTFSLRWPDYGGEQVSDILSSRSLSNAWQQRIDQSNGWLLFLRLGADANPADALQRPAGRHRKTETVPSTVPAAPPSTTTGVKWNSNARAVELMQMLLHAKRVSLYNRIRIPPLAVALSCWDELNEQARPDEVLARRMPMLHEFLTAVWAADCLAVFGLSSLGGSLDVPQVSAAHRDAGPESQGFVVKPGGTRTTDLAEPVTWLLNQMP